MTPKEKAEELIKKFKPMCHDVTHTGILNGLATVMNDEFINLCAAKVCASIAVNEIMKAIGWEEMELGVERDNYWDEVKQEIEKL